MGTLIPALRRRIAGIPGVRRVLRLFDGARPASDATATNCEYWTNYNVTEHRRFATAEESLQYFNWRNRQYHNYIELMPVTGQDGQSVLDYGCGPGNDLVGFSVFSNPRRLIGMDISPSSLAEAKLRVALHRANTELLQISEANNRIPLDDRSIDYIHSSGVVHHATDPASVLCDFRRVLKPTGRCRIMVYYYDCIWLHLCVAYIKRIREKTFTELSLRAAFGKMTDTTACPISRVYKPEEFIALAESCGFRCRFLGAAIAMAELALLPQRFEALRCPELPQEQRDFLTALTFDGNGFPLYNGTFAGIDGCYELLPAV